MLEGLRVLQVGPGIGAAVFGRLFADLGASVSCIDECSAAPIEAYLNSGKGRAHGVEADVDIVVYQGASGETACENWTESALRQRYPTAEIVLISPYGQTGPQANWTGTDLTLFCASGISRMLTGQVVDLSEPPTRPVGQQSAFISGLAAACAAMHGVLARGTPAMVDISIHEALATLAITELTRAGVHGRSWSRKRIKDGNGATVTILPAKDGYVAISPREDHQWASWLKVMGSPEWGGDPRFTTKPDRAENFDALHALMSDWSRQHGKQWIADTAQAARVPSYPLRELTEQFTSPQLQHRNFFREIELGGSTVKVPRAPFNLSHTGTNVGAPPFKGPLPLSGIRVLDFSWVIAGPTTTRYLAAMGAEVIKVEAPGRGDPGRASELHTVLGQAKKAIVLNLKDPHAVDIARDLARKSDILIENFGTGIMERFGLGAEALHELNPGLVYISASGQGRTGPEAKGVAYGTLLQCYSGFAGLNGHPGIDPRVGMAWVDPMCGLKLAFIAAAGLWHRQNHHQGTRVDFSMIEALLWTMAEPIITAQLDGPPTPQGNADPVLAPHGVFAAQGEDAWVGLAVTNDEQWQALCQMVPGLAPDMDRRGQAVHDVLEAWISGQPANTAAAVLREIGVAAEPVASSMDLLNNPHLAARSFWDDAPDGRLPGLPWRTNFGRALGSAPGLGADTDAVMRDVLDLPAAEIARLRADGVFG